MPKVMLAEDDPTMLSLLMTLLKMEGYEVGMLPNQDAEVIELIRREQPDALLIDVYLGTRNGLDLVRAIREKEGLRRTRIVMASGIDKRKECLAAGADAFLLKPYMPDDLIKQLRH